MELRKRVKRPEPVPFSKAGWQYMISMKTRAKNVRKQVDIAVTHSVSFQSSNTSILCTIGIFLNTDKEEKNETANFHHVPTLWIVNLNIEISNDNSCLRAIQLQTTPPSAKMEYRKVWIQTSYKCTSRNGVQNRGWNARTHDIQRSFCRKIIASEALKTNFVKTQSFSEALVTIFEWEVRHHVSENALIVESLATITKWEGKATSTVRHKGDHTLITSDHCIDSVLCMWPGCRAAKICIPARSARENLYGVRLSSAWFIEMRRDSIQRRRAECCSS